MRLQCSCSAFFPTGDAFRAHLDEYRTLEGYLSAQLKIYRSHSKVNSDDPDSDGHDPDVYEDAEGPGIKHNCPFKGCNRNESFRTRQRLRRHFEQHVKCEEVCVCCQHVSRRARDYIRHAERHQDVGMIKTTYIKQMCDELRKRAADELDLAERLSDVERGNKRAREVGDVGSRTSGVQRAKLQRVGVTNELDFQPANGIDPLQMSSLSSHQTRCTNSRRFHAVSDSTYASLECCRTRTQSRFSEHFNGGVLSHVYRRTCLSSGRYRLRCSYI